MNKLIKYLPIACLIACLFIVLSLPVSFTNLLREKTIKQVMPLWTRATLFADFLIASPVSMDRKNSDVIHQLKLENRLLNEQIEGVYEWLQFEERVQEQIDNFHKICESSNGKEVFWNDFFRRRAEEMRLILETELQSLPGKVLYRDPSSWSSCVWVNVGRKHNESLGREIIAKNSPVIIGDNLIGLVDYVGATTSKVRLITDEALNIAVRVVRGKKQNREVTRLIKSLESRLFDREDIFTSKEEKKLLLDQLKNLRSRLKESSDEWYLAKGEICGAGKPLWRSLGQKLKGKGFNYCYEDEEGSSRNLYSGHLDTHSEDYAEPMPLIKKGDLLITSGLDGIFPRGLKVGIVSDIEKLTETAYAYDIEADAVVDNLNELTMVFILPPLPRTGSVEI